MSRHKIIVFGLLNHQHVLNFSSALKQYLGYELIGIDNNPDYRPEKSKEAKSIYSRVYKAKRSKVPFLDKLLKTLSTIFYFLFVDKNTDFVLFHFLSKFVLPLARISKWRGMKTCVFVFGSDFKRADDSYMRYINKVFNKVDHVVCDSTDMMEDLKAAFPNYSGKINCCYFGSPIVDELLSDNWTRERAKERLKLCDGERKVVMCGYNGAKAQNHAAIIDALTPFSDKVHFIFPMTYSCDDIYRDSIRSICEHSDLSYTILDHFLENEEWRNYLYATDIFIHMQLTDAFSACLAENLLIGNVVINSEWIDYPDLDKAGAYYLSANFENLQSIFENVLSQYDFYFEKSKNNRAVIERFKGLKYTVKKYWGPYFDTISE